MSDLHALEPYDLLHGKDNPEEQEDRFLHDTLIKFLLNFFIVSNSFLFLVVRPGAPSSVLAPSSDAPTLALDASSNSSSSKENII